MLCALALSLVTAVSAAPVLFGDLDNDGQASSADLVLLVNHNDPGLPSLPPALLPYADADRSGTVNQGDVDWIVQTLLGQVASME